MPRTKAKKPESPVTRSTHYWQWAVALGLLAGIVAGSAYAVVQHGKHSSVDELETRRVEPLPSPPIAQVVLGRDRYFLDETGQRLPSAADSPRGLIEIQGVEAPPRGKLGAKWGTPVVEAAARLARLIEADRGRLAIVAIEVDENSIQPELRLRTKGGTRVLWQRWPESASGTTVTEEGKLQRLHIYIEREGSLDKPAGPYVLDVRPAEGLRKVVP